MIYHLQTYLETIFPAENIVAESMEVNDPQEMVMIRFTGGPQRTYPDNRVDDNVQVLVMKWNNYAARSTANQIYDACRELFHFTLPAPAITGETEIDIIRMQAIQKPVSLGPDESGMYVYSNNYQLTYAGPPYARGTGE